MTNDKNQGYVYTYYCDECLSVFPINRPCPHFPGMVNEARAKVSEDTAKELMLNRKIPSK